MPKIPYGPTYDEMLNPSHQDPDVRMQAIKALKINEFDPINLFNITWKNENNDVNKIVLPRKLTGVDANIIVMLGKYFPSGSHKVGPAYSTLIEGCIDGDIIPGKHTILGASTGNFGIGVSYIANLMKYDSVVVMPNNMSKERYERIKKYGAKLDLIEGSDSGIISTLERSYELVKNPKNKLLAQFELLPNYRFHRYVTGNSAIEAVKGIGNERISCFCSAPGSGGTLGAGDGIKAVFPECKIVALEPRECATLSNGCLGHHRIEGVGDKMIALIHNILNTDYVAQISDNDCVRGLAVIHEGTKILEKHGISREIAKSMVDLFGVSGICNILGAIKMAKYFKLGSNDNIVTIATDSFDRYPSVIEDLHKRENVINDEILDKWFNDIFLKVDTSYILDTRSKEKKEMLFKKKENDWLKYGYNKEYLESMKNAQFWEKEYSKVFEYDKKILKMREKEFE